MILRPFSLKKVQKYMNESSPKCNNKLKYMRLKSNRQKSSKVGRSLCSIQTYSNSNPKRIMSHRKLISVSSLDNKQILTDRKCTVQSQNLKSFRNLNKQQGVNINKKNFHFNKFSNIRQDRLYTIQNQECQNNIEKVLEIKENILKEFIDRFQQQLREISQQKSSRKTLVTQRVKTQTQKNETTKKQRRPMFQMESNNSTININVREKRGSQQQGVECQKNKFEDYIKSIQNIKNKDKKILIMKNQKKSIQNISICKIGQTQNITSRIRTKRQNMINNNNNKLNLKQLFKHSKKYQPYLRQSSTMNIQQKSNNNKIQSIKQKCQNQQISSLLSPIRCKEQNQHANNKNNINSIETEKQNIRNEQGNSSKYKSGHKDSGYIDCSSIQKINQSSFISQMGRNSILKHLQNQTIKIVKNQQRKSKKCLAKMKNIFPSDFF